MEKQQVPRLQTMLVDLTLDRVDLVHTGSNTRADILLTKGKEQSNMPETFEELLGLLKPEQQAIVKAHIESVEKSLKDEAEEKINALANENEELKKTAPVEQPPVVETKPEEEIMKGASPELVAHIQKMQLQVTELLNREAEALAKSRFDAVKALPCEEAELKEVLKSASPATFAILEKAAKAVEESVLKAKGKDVEGTFAESTDAAYATLEKAARTMMEANTGLTFEKAFADACSSNPEVYTKYVKGAK